MNADEILKYAGMAWNFVNTLGGVAMLFSVGLVQIIKTWATKQEQELSGGKLKALSGAATFFGFYLLCWLWGTPWNQMRTPANLVNAVVAAVAGPYVAQVGKWALKKYAGFDLNTFGAVEKPDEPPR